MSFIDVTDHEGFFVPVGSTNYRLKFTYTTVEASLVGDTNNSRLDMSDGRVKIEIPTSKGWAVTASSLRPVPEVSVTGHTTNVDLTC